MSNKPNDTNEMRELWERAEHAGYVSAIEHFTVAHIDIMADFASAEVRRREVEIADEMNAMCIREFGDLIAKTLHLVSIRSHPPLYRGRVNRVRSAQWR